MSVAVSIDLTTNSDDEGAFHTGGSRKRRRNAHSKSPGKRSSRSPERPKDIVDLTANTPTPECSRADHRSLEQGKALDFEVDTPKGGVAAGGSSAMSQSNRKRGGHDSAGCSASSAASRRSLDPLNDYAVPGNSVPCPICCISMTASERMCLSCNHWACIKCLTERAMGEGTCHSCHSRISLSDMRQFLSTEQINKSSEALLQRLLNSNANFIRCPNETCANVFERMEPSPRDSRGEGASLPKCAPDGQPLTVAQAKHMQENRFRCEACSTNFCASCKIMPYHAGATCRQAQAARSAAKCLFCKTQLPRGKDDGSCCNSEECKARLQTSCEIKLACGHKCLGTFGESQCPPCLECSGQADDFCNICWTEELRAAPCIHLRCGHVFHLHCARERLKMQWPTPKISFSFAKCPLCSKWVDHPELEGMMRSVHALRNKVEMAALERYRIEGLAATKEKPRPPSPAAPAAAGGAAHSKGGSASSNKGRSPQKGLSLRAGSKGAKGAFTEAREVQGEITARAMPAAGDNDEEDIQAAMRRYNFYLCVKCDRPYFGGVAACGAVEEASAGAAGGAGDANGAHANQPRRGMGGSDEVLMCGSCSAKASGMAAASCARHGEQYIEFKCRFCCSIATFFCFGHTHFCEKCHKKWCDGYSSKPKQLVQKCSCGQKHAPNGTERSSEACYGCSLCRIVSKEAAPL